MLKIAICDDDAGDRERIAEDLRVYAAAHQEHSIEMTVYSSAFAMLDAFEKAGCPDIALLDICMPGMLGTELARDILRCSENTDILITARTSPRWTPSRSTPRTTFKSRTRRKNSTPRWTV